jgi:DNA-binding CsgD family transcriptional regulator
VPLAAFTLLNRGLLHCFAGDLRRGLPELEEGVAATEALREADLAPFRQDAGFRGAVRGTLVTWLASAGRFEEARVMGERVVRGASGVIGGDLYQGLRNAYAALGRPDDATTAFHHTCSAYRAAEHFTILGAIIGDHLAWVTIPYRTDDLAERAQLGREGDAANERIRGVFVQHSSHWARMPLLHLEGDWAEAERAALLWLAGGTSGTTALRLLGPIAYHRGDRETAWEWVREGLPAGRATVPGEVGEFLDILILQRLAAALAIDAGDLPTAREWLEMHDRWHAWSDAMQGRAEGALVWATYFRAAEERDVAYERAKEALEHATAPRQPLALLAAHRLLGELDTDHGQFTDAEEHLTAALALAEACVIPYERALTLIARAELRAATGEREAAQMLANEARTICAALGARPALARADVLIAQLATRQPALPAYPDRLTTREVEVLRLIAQGRSNQEIATALFISTRTVNRHIENLYRKIGAHGKADATAYALRQHLA